MTDLPPAIREARHKVLYWMMGSNTDSTEAAERNGKLLDALVTALCAWQRAQTLREVKALHDHTNPEKLLDWIHEQLEALK